MPNLVLFPVAADGITGAIFQRFICQGDFFRTLRLAEDGTVASCIDAMKELRGGATALIAVDAGVVHIEAAGYIFEIFGESVSHIFVSGLSQYYGAKCSRIIHKWNTIIQIMNQFLSTVPFDLYELHLLHLVAEHRSFTKTAAAVGLTQSAVTRQIQGVENRIGVSLLDRTTRQVKLTPAGDLLLSETRHLLGDIESSLRRLREDFGTTPKEVRVGVSNTIGLAYLPGFFFANQRKFPEVGIKVRHESSQNILSALEIGDLDVGVICPPNNLPTSLQVTHRFNDAFTFIIPAKMQVTQKESGASFDFSSPLLNSQTWLHISERSNTGTRLRQWILDQRGRIKISSEMDSFDLIIHLVSLGLGVSLVPQRALASYPRKRTIRQLVTKERFTRELVVLTRRSVRTVFHVERFVENILF